MPPQLNIANPSTGCQKLIEIDDEKKLCAESPGPSSASTHATPGRAPQEPQAQPSEPARPPLCRRSLYDKRLAAEVDGEDIGDEFKGYVFKIKGGQDKQGFSMKQGVLTADRVKLMMAKGTLLHQRTRQPRQSPGGGRQRRWRHGSAVGGPSCSRSALVRAGGAVA